MSGEEKSGAGLTIEAWEKGAAFYVKAHAGSKRDGVLGVHDGMLKIAVTTAPEKGKANKAIIKLLAKSLSLTASDFALLSGQTNSRKRFGVSTLAPDALREAVTKVLS